MPDLIGVGSGFKREPLYFIRRSKNDIDTALITSPSLAKTHSEIAVSILYPAVVHNHKFVLIRLWCGIPAFPEVVQGDMLFISRLLFQFFEQLYFISFGDIFQLIYNFFKMFRRRKWQ